jgi:tRNA U34 5-methylaminomethyl-2-thiouridine-forming methyltransferase MnmC
MVRFGVQARLEGTAVLVLPEQLYRAARVPVFTGFDEVRLFEHERPEKEVPSRLVLTSDAVDFNERLPDALEAYMRETRCVLALGDGCGLNYATWDSAFAAFIEAKFQASMGDGEK